MVLEKERLEHIRACIKLLSPRTRKFLQERLSGKTLKETAAYFECSSERVRQIEVKAFQRIRESLPVGLFEEVYTPPTLRPSLWELRKAAEFQKVENQKIEEARAASRFEEWKRWFNEFNKEVLAHALDDQDPK